MTEPPIRLSERRQFAVIAGLLVWGAVVVVAGVVFTFAYLRTAPADQPAAPSTTPQQMIPDRNHIPQKR